MWYERCQNPQAFERMYDSGEGLDRVRLFGVALRPHGSHVQLRVELPRFPDHPPRRWSPGANAVQVTVDFWFVRELKLEGWSGESEGLLTLTPEGDDLRLAFESDAVRLSALCLMARIDRFTAYADGRPEEVEVLSPFPVPPLLQESP